jgi:hypothetical protein
VLQVTAADMLRPRHNPFYAYQEQRMLTFIGVETDVQKTYVKR